MPSGETFRIKGIALDLGPKAFDCRFFVMPIELGAYVDFLVA
jgi:hypothetical protein